MLLIQKVETLEFLVLPCKISFLDDKGKNVVFDFSLPRDTVKDSALGHLYITGILIVRIE